MVRAVLLEVCGTQDLQHGSGWAAGDNNIVFYADDGGIAGRNPIWVQKNLTVVLMMFERVGLQTNIGNNKSMV